jgi:hypothetical protein
MPMAEGDVYEIRLSAKGNSSLQFVTVKTDEKLAELHARALLARYPEYTRAELWRGMRLLKEIEFGSQRFGHT